MNETAPVNSPSSETRTPPQAKQKSGFIPGDPRVPTLVRVYGAIIAAMSICGMILVVIRSVIVCLMNLERGGPFVLLFGGIQAVIAFVLYRLGRGLCNGQRLAVYGICILGGVALLLAIGIMIGGSAVGGLVLLAFIAVFYVPPILVAFRRWGSFK